MAGYATDDRGKKAVPPLARGAETSHHPDPAPVVLAVCGDPVVGRALVLLLQSSRYDARFLAAPSLRGPGALEGTHLLLLTPGLDPKCHEALQAGSENVLDGTAQIPVLKLVSSSGGTREEAPSRLECEVHWPCSTGELERRIEAALLADSGPTETR